MGFSGYSGSRKEVTFGSLLRRFAHLCHCSGPVLDHLWTTWACSWPPRGGLLSRVRVKEGLLSRVRVKEGVPWAELPGPGTTWCTLPCPTLPVHYRVLHTPAPCTAGYMLHAGGVTEKKNPPGLGLSGKPG